MTRPRGYQGLVGSAVKVEEPARPARRPCGGRVLTSSPQRRLMDYRPIRAAGRTRPAPASTHQGATNFERSVSIGRK